MCTSTAWLILEQPRRQNQKPSVCDDRTNCTHILKTYANEMSYFLFFNHVDKIRNKKVQNVRVETELRYQCHLSKRNYDTAIKIEVKAYNFTP
jgi:hypothetical protein